MSEAPYFIDVPSDRQLEELKTTIRVLRAPLPRRSRRHGGRGRKPPMPGVEMGRRRGQMEGRPARGRGRLTS
jgi:hypothetical protein